MKWCGSAAIGGGWKYPFLSHQPVPVHCHLFASAGQSASPAAFLAVAPVFAFSSLLPLSDLSRQKAARTEFRRNLLSNVNRIFRRNDPRWQSVQFGDLRGLSNFAECLHTLQYFGGDQQEVHDTKA
jgi:hypothetical protein